MTEKLDGKFYGRIFREKDGTEVPADQFIVFLAKDRALMPTLEFYRAECERLGCERPQLEAVQDLMCRVQGWQTSRQGEMKLPDVDPGEINTDVKPIATAADWYNERDVQQWLEREAPASQISYPWLTLHLNRAFQKGRQIGRGELEQEQAVAKAHQES